MIKYIWCFEQFRLSSPDVNKNKGVAEKAYLTTYHGNFIRKQQQQQRLNEKQKHVKRIVPDMCRRTF